MKSRLPNEGRVDPAAYYDDFAGWYDRGRDRGYHALVDELELAALRPHLSPGARVLEAGCGTGLILSRIEQALHELEGPRGAAVGVDLSAGMLAHARRRGLRGLRATVTRLPFPDASFDVVCSFKVLAHVPDAPAALAELARVLRPGGRLVVEYYNPRSLRYLIKRLRPARRISAREDDSAVYTRYDSLAAIRSYLPPGMTVLAVRGLRVVTPLPSLLEWPAVGPALAFAERLLARAPLARGLGGFLVVAAQKAPG